MMVTTHLVVGLLFALPFISLFPEQTALLLAAAGFGSLFPDFDIVLGEHRRTLHFPVYGTGVAVLFVCLFLLVSTMPVAVVALLAIGIAQHSVSDIVGGGLERRPWEQNSDKAVYAHSVGSWVEPKHLVSYDGSGGDFALTVIGAMGIAVFLPEVEYLLLFVVLVVSVGAVYTGVRKWLPKVELVLYKQVPVLRPFLNGLHGPD